MKKNNRAARAARFLVHCFDVFLQTTAWNFPIWSWRQHQLAALNLYMKTIRAKQAKVHSAYIFYNANNMEYSQMT